MLDGMKNIPKRRDRVSQEALGETSVLRRYFHPIVGGIESAFETSAWTSFEMSSDLDAKFASLVLPEAWAHPNWWLGRLQVDMTRI